MGGVSPETCWASYKYGIIKFSYIVASCWIFLYEFILRCWIFLYEFILRCWIFLYELYTKIFHYELYAMMLDFFLWIVYYDDGFFFMNCILWCWIFLYELYTMMLDFSLWIVYYDVGFFFMNLYYDVGFFFMNCILWFFIMNCILWCWIFFMNCILWWWFFLYELYTMMLDFSLWILYYDAQIHEHQVCGIKFDWTGWGRRLFKCWTSERSRTKEVGRSVGRSGTFHSKSFH